MHCPACHKDNPPRATHCDFCRTPLPDASSRYQPTVPVSGVSVPDQSFEVGGLIAGRYLVERELGRGGMGVVYLVRDQKLHGKEVALKLISAELTTSHQGQERFVQEVLAAQELHHQNIVRVFHLDEVAGQSFFTMEYVPGRSLREVVEERKRQGQTFSLKECEAVLMPVLKALHHAHTQNPPVIHRDIKPDNIIVTGDFSSPQVKVLDFGLAKMLSPSKLTTTAMTMGTAYYMAPEQVKGARDIDQRADLFSVGVVLYEMLTGEVPSGFFSMPSELNEELSESVDEVIKQTLQQIPDRRVSSARELAAALEGLAKGADEEARRKQHEAEEAVKRQAESEARRVAQEEARRKVEEEARLKAESEARRREEVEAKRKADDEARKRQLEAERLEDEEIARLKAEAESRRRKMFFAAAGIVLVVLAFFVWKGLGKLGGPAPVANPQSSSPAAFPQTAPQAKASASKKYTLTIRPEPSDAEVEFLNQNMMYRPGIQLDPGTYEMRVSRKGYLPRIYDARIGDRDLVADVSLERDAPASPASPVETYALTIRPTPSDAQVKILNIKPKYQAGLKLEAGKYKIEVSKPGYKTFLGTVDIVDQDVVATAELAKEVDTVQSPVVSPNHAPPSKGDTWRDSVTGMEFVWIPGGCYLMGNNDGASDERPVHEVCVDGFWMGRYEVRQAEWKQIMGNNPSRIKWDRKPVEQVSWVDAQEFIRKLNAGGNGRFRLPTEAEWEYAARSGGRNEKYAGGQDVNSVAWYKDNSGGKPQPVGAKAPNGMGLYDMSGNVSEWCQDVYDALAYSKHSRNNPLLSIGPGRIFRGGSWHDSEWGVRVDDRNYASPTIGYSNIGFRIIKTN